MADFGAHADAPDDPDRDLVADFDFLLSDLRSLVPSLIGVSWTTATARQPYTLTVLVDGADTSNVHSSLAIPLGPLIPPNAASELIVYAAAPGACRVLADPSFTTLWGVSAFTLDQHLEVRPSSAGAAAAAFINRATGVLLGRGYSPTQADDQLNQLMSQSAVTRSAAADQVLRTVGSRR